MTTRLLESTNASSSIDSIGSTIKIPSFSFMLGFLSEQINLVAEKTTAAFVYSSQVLTQLPAKLHSSRWIYGLYGLLDGVNTAFSTLKYACDVHYANTSFSSADKLHDFLLTPEGIVIVVTECFLLASFSAIGNVFDNDEIEHTAWKQWSVILLRYVRDVLKALKNAYKGVNNVLTLLSILARQADILRLVLPIGVALGVVSAFNQMFIRYMRDKRQDKIKINQSLLEKISALKLDEAMEPKDWDKLLKGTAKTADKEAILGMQTQSLWYSVLGYAVAIYDGFLYAPYLYLGLVSLAILSPPLFFIITTFAIFFVIIGIATRVFEEYNDQRLLLISQTKLELAVCIAQLKCLSKKIDKKLQEKDPTVQDFFVEVERKIRETVRLKETLQQQTVLSTTAVILGGLLNGMNAVQALTSLAFAVSSICLITATPFPVLLLMSLGPISIVFLVGFVGLALTKHWEFLKKNPAPESSLKNKTDDLVERLKKQSQDVTVEEVHSIADLIEEVPIKASPQTSFEKNIDIFRSFFTGGRKGMRSVDETMVSFQDVGADGHYHNTPIMATIAWVSAGLFASVFVLRGLARLGKTKKEAVVERQAPSTPSTLASTSSSDDSDEKEPPDITAEKINTESPKKETTSIKKALSYQILSRFGLFSEQPTIDAPDVINEDASTGHYTSLADDTSETSYSSR